MITTIHRRTKEEAEKAISDLLKRGWHITYDLTEKRSSIATRGSYNHTKSRYTSKNINESSCWIAQMRKDDEK
jgi:hypothetical protein